MRKDEATVTIYDEVGGPAAVKSAVTVFYNRVLEDESLAQWFDGVDLSRLRAHQRAFLAAALDGPQLFAGRDLHEAHGGMAITDEAFTTVVGHLCTALLDLDVTSEVVAKVQVRLEALRPAIVGA